MMIVMLLLAVTSAGSIGKTRINYDLTRYLAEDTMTKRALRVMEEEFGSSEQLRVMFHDLDDETLASCLSALNDRPEILAAQHDPEPGVAIRDGVRYQLVTLTLTDCDSAALVRELRAMFPEAGEYEVGGPVSSGRWGSSADIEKLTRPGMLLQNIHAIHCILDDLTVIEGQPFPFGQNHRAIPHVKPSGLRGVVPGFGAKFARFDAHRVGGGNRPASGITSRRAIDAHQVKRQAIQARLLLKLPGRGLLDGLALIGKAPRQRPAAQERVAAPADQQQLQTGPAFFKHGDVRRQSGLGIVL